MKLVLKTLASAYNSWQNLNFNSTATATAMENTLSRDGTSPNQMGALLDMNSHPIINMSNATTLQGATTLAQVTALLGTTPTTPSNPIAANVANYAALKAVSMTGVTTGTLFYCRGFATDQDGGEGFWEVKTSSPGADNGGTILWSNTSGFYFKRVFQGPLVDLWFGVVADGVTDNSTALQAVETAANAANLPIYYPPRGVRLITTGITTYNGLDHYGCTMDRRYYSGAGYVGQSAILYTGTGDAFSIQNANGVSGLPGPSWHDMNIFCSNGSQTGHGIRLNSIAGGFTDDGTTQIAMTESIIERVGFIVAARNSTACIQFNKVVDGAIRDCLFLGGDYSIDMQGSDNISIMGNSMNNPTVACINLITHGTFGNMAWVRDNSMSTPYINATAHVISNYRVLHLTGNYIETQNGTLAKGGIWLSGGLEAFIRDNQIDSNTPLSPNWLVVDGSFIALHIEGNTSLGGAIGPANFNSGGGMKLLYNNAGIATVISGGNNGYSDVGIPFFTKTNNPVKSPGFPISGATLWDISSELYGGGLVGTGAYDLSVMARAPNISYVIPSMTGGNSQINLTDPYGDTLTTNVDVWVRAMSGGGANAAFLTVIAGANSANQTLPASTGMTWYKALSNVSVTALTQVSMYCTSSLGGFGALVERVRVVKT